MAGGLGFARAAGRARRQPTPHDGFSFHIAATRHKLGASKKYGLRIARMMPRARSSPTWYPPAARRTKKIGLKNISLPCGARQEKGASRAAAAPTCTSRVACRRRGRGAFFLCTTTPRIMQVRAVARTRRPECFRTRALLAAASLCQEHPASLGSINRARRSTESFGGPNWAAGHVSSRS